MSVVLAYADPKHCINAIPLFVSVADPDPSDPYVFGPPNPDPSIIKQNY